MEFGFKRICDEFQENSFLVKAGTEVSRKENLNYFLLRKY
jgi:hypothetical protein